jgi:hypothetical protein
VLSEPVAVQYVQKVSWLANKYNKTTDARPTSVIFEYGNGHITSPRNTVRLVNRKRKQAELKRTYETKSTEARNVPIILFAGHFRFDRSSSPWPLAVTIDNGIVMNCGCVTLGSVWARLKMTPLLD